MEMTRKQALRAHLQGYGSLRPEEVEAIITFTAEQRDWDQRIVTLALLVCEARAEGFPYEERLDKLHEALVRRYTLGEKAPAKP